VEYVALLRRGEERRGACRIVMGKPEERDYFEDVGIDGRMILKSMLKNRLE
jgi:hypothetical protein